MSFPNYIQGTFKEELKNRFLCLVEIDNQDILCYVPSSCRLSNFVVLSGKTVLLSPIESTNSRTKYSLFAIKVKRRFIPINLASINELMYHHLPSRKFSYLGKRKTVSRECTIQGYKCDLFIDDTKTIIENKSLLSFDLQGTFPTVHSDRAIKQLEKLEALLTKGYHVCYFFFSLNPKVTQISINKSMIQYYDMMQRCLKKGMKVRGYSVDFKQMNLSIGKEISVIVT